MFKIFNRVSYNFSKSYDLAVIGGGPGGIYHFIQVMSLPSKLHNLDSIQFVSKKEDHLEVLVSMSAVSLPKLSSISLTNITNSITNLNLSE